MEIEGFLFDMDGTVVEVPYDWKKIKRELNTGGKTILSYIESLDEPQKSEKRRQLEAFEKDATIRAEIKQGIPEFLSKLNSRGRKTALVTNNSRDNVDYLLQKFKIRFDIVLSRECGLWKPSGAPLIAAMKELNLSSRECCVVGDSWFDIKAAMDAEVPHIFILSADRSEFTGSTAEIFPTVADLEKRLGY